MGRPATAGGGLLGCKEQAKSPAIHRAAPTATPDSDGRGYSTAASDQGEVRRAIGNGHRPVSAVVGLTIATAGFPELRLVRRASSPHRVQAGQYATYSRPRALVGARLTGDAKAVFFELAVQRRPPDAELLGHPADVAAVPADGRQEGEAFRLYQRIRLR